LGQDYEHRMPKQQQPALEVSAALILLDPPPTGENQTPRGARETALDANRASSGGVPGFFFVHKF
jgi:hypothetical protein